MIVALYGVIRVIRLSAKTTIQNPTFLVTEISDLTPNLRERPGEKEDHGNEIWKVDKKLRNKCSLKQDSDKKFGDT